MGKTHGIRFRISPPRKAKASTRGSGGSAGSGAGPGGAVTVTLVCRPERSRIDSTPLRPTASEAGFCGFSDRTKPPARTDSNCGAMSWIRPGASGTNHASITVVVFSSGPFTHSAPSAEMLLTQGDGRGTMRSCSTNKGACAEGVAEPVGRSSRKSPSSGTQISLHTSQVA